MPRLLLRVQYDSELNVEVDAEELALVVSPRKLRGRPSHGTFRIPLEDDEEESPTSAQFRPLNTSDSNLEDVLASGVLQKAVAAARATSKLKQAASHKRNRSSDDQASVTSADASLMDDTARALVTKVRAIVSSAGMTQCGPDPTLIDAAAMSHTSTGRRPRHASACLAERVACTTSSYPTCGA